MTFHSKIVRHRREAAKGPMRAYAAGAATINIDQKMRLARIRVARAGTIKDDWKAVGADLRKSICQVRRELESA